MHLCMAEVSTVTDLFVNTLCHICSFGIYNIGNELLFFFFPFSYYVLEEIECGLCSCVLLSVSVCF